MDIEKAAILAAGKSTRMGKPKPLVKVSGYEMLLYHLERFRRVGIRDVSVVVSHDAESEISLLLSKKSSIGPVSIVVQERQDGEVGALKCLKIGEPFILVEVDTFVSLDALYKLTSQENNTMTVVRVNDTKALSKVIVEKGIVKRIEEKVAGGSMADAGTYFFMPSVLDAAETVRPSGRGELEMTSLLNLLIDGHQLNYVMSRSWVHFTSQKDVACVKGIDLLS